MHVQILRLEFLLGGFMGRIMYIDILDVGNNRMIKSMSMQLKIQIAWPREQSFQLELQKENKR
jgi:hypothetical protein